MTYPELETPEYTEIQPVLECVRGVFWFSVDSPSANLYYHELGSAKLSKLSLKGNQKSALDLQFDHFNHRFILFKNLLIG
jgi:hypothetical protein